MEITKIQRQLAEERASEIQQRLYGEPESGEQLWNIASKYNLTERAIYYIFTQLVGDIVLGFYTQDQIGALIANKLPQVQGPQRIALEADIKIFLYPLVDSHYQSPQTPTQPIATELEREIKVMEKQVELTHLSPIAATPSSETQNNTTQFQPLSKPDHTIHTMAQDMAAIRQQQAAPIYSSTQADILTRPNSIPTTPSPISPGSQPRWESE